MSYEIGHFYSVPCVKTNKSFKNGREIGYWGGEWIPVIGPQHRDAEIINFPYLHWHIDWRFVSETVYRRVAGSRLGRFVLAMPLMKHPAGYHREEDLSETIVETGEVVMKRRKCKRAFQTWESHRKNVEWLKPLEKSCAGLRMVNMTCPHRGTPLVGCPQENGIVHCPSHGLRWNVKTGEMVT